MDAVSDMVYVATPIDQAGYTVSRVLVDVDIEGALDAAGLVGYWPSKAFTVSTSSSITSSIEAANRAVLDVCVGLVAVLPAGVPTIGVPREIEYAMASGIPVAVLSDVHSWSLSDVEVHPLTPEGAKEAVAVAGAGQRPDTAIAVRVGPEGALPTRAHETDAGYDLYVSETVTLEPGVFTDVETDIHIALPPHMWGRITGRSSTLRKKGLLVAEAVIDGGYRGPIFSGVWNLGDEPVEVRAGERLAQLIPHFNVALTTPVVEVSAEVYDAIPHDGRGIAGFGSSGK